MAIYGYVPLDAFSDHGDIGRFVHGLNISPWPVFILGTALAALGIIRIFSREIIKVYVFAPIRTLVMKRVLLGTSLFLIFLFLFVRGFNPFTGTGIFVKAVAGISILLAPALFIACDPARSWVKRSIG